MKQSILIVDDDAATRFGFSRYLAKDGYNIKEASTLMEAREEIVAQRFDAVILDHKLPDGEGIDWIHDLRKACPDVAIVMITGVGDVPVAVEAMRRGADNFLTKPVNMEDLAIFLQKSLEVVSLRRKDATRQRLEKKDVPFFGESDAMKKVHELATVAGENDSTVLLLGETGTGKGVLAKWIHEHSYRKSGAYVEINCSGLRGELLASELFGHTKGAFTSAVQDRQGLVEIADGGTLFLDEIADMDMSVQAQFLKVIEEKQFRRLGEAKVRKSDFRLLCATNKDLEEEVRQGRFRQDLYFRIQVFPVLIPPLRERPGDLPPLVKHLISALQSTHPEVSPEIMSLLTAYPWPGNIREMKNVLERALLLARGGPVGPAHFSGLGSGKTTSSGLGDPQNLDQLEEEYIEAVMKRSGGDIEKAVKTLGISRATLYRKLKKSRES
ncbi:MAG TPA: sigma-54-dependent Fis family transcriptional regulator [Nitrospiraceae bacterium]|nr:sigma-54-dependent Fis family transcriptional regulator [Nitrospiraceae bacterium]